jgi:hypothetical protein
MNIFYNKDSRTYIIKFYKNKTFNGKFLRVIKVLCLNISRLIALIGVGKVIGKKVIVNGFTSLYLCVNSSYMKVDKLMTIVYNESYFVFLNNLSFLKFKHRNVVDYYAGLIAK